MSLADRSRARANEAAKGVSRTSAMPVAHLGLMRTGTTFLQKKVFPSHHQMHYLGRCIPFFDNPRGMASVEQCRHAMVAARNAMHATGRVPVVSYERVMHGGVSDFQRRVEWIAEVWMPCRVMVVLRQPHELIESLYSNMMRQRHLQRERCWGRRIRFADFDDWIEQQWAKPNHGQFSNLNYGPKLKHAADRFGIESVGVFLYETMQGDMTHYLRQVSRFMGVEPAQADTAPINAKMNMLQWSALRYLCTSPGKALRFRFATRAGRHRLLDAAQHRLPDTHRIERLEWPEQWRQRIADYNRPSNQLLRDLWGLDLSEHGYPV